MPDDVQELTPVQQAEAAYADGQRPAPHVALRWHPEIGELPGVPTFSGEYTPAQTAQYLTRAQYDAALAAGIASRMEAPKTAAPKARPSRETPSDVPAPEKEGES